jgi:hypothetical protein
MKRLLFVMGVCFSVTLAIVFGTRVSADALAVIIGVVLGVLSGVPTALLFAYAITRRQANQNGQTPMSYQPPVIVVNGNERATGSAHPPSTPLLPPPTQGRQWTVIGDSDTDDRSIM